MNRAGIPGGSRVWNASASYKRRSAAISSRTGRTGGKDWSLASRSSVTVWPAERGRAYPVIEPEALSGRHPRGRVLPGKERIAVSGHPLLLLEGPEPKLAGRAPRETRRAPTKSMIGTVRTAYQIATRICAWLLRRCDHALAPLLPSKRLRLGVCGCFQESRRRWPLLRHAA